MDMETRDCVGEVEGADTIGESAKAAEGFCNEEER